LAEKPPAKKLQGYQIFDFPLSLITERVFIAETCAWVRWKGNLLSQIQKIEKNQQKQSFFKKNWFR
jgi:hypothetical protein